MIAVTFTERASDYIQKMIEKERGIGLRLTIKRTGCSGYTYAPSVVNEINSQDQQCVLKNGVKVFIDPNWESLLSGLQIDYIEEEKSGLKQKRLTFTNPHEGARCGCGESFTTKANE